MFAAMTAEQMRRACANARPFDSLDHGVAYRRMLRQAKIVVAGEID